MSKTLDALFNGKVVRLNSVNEVYYKKSNGQYYYSGTNEMYSAWAISKADDDLFKDDDMWRIVK